MEYIYSCHGCAGIFSATAEAEICSLCQCGFIELTLLQEHHSDDDDDDVDDDDSTNGNQMVSEPENYVTSQTEFERVVDGLFQQATNEYINAKPKSVTKVDDLPEFEIDQSTVDEGLKCVICQEEYELKTRTLQLSCSHFFHKNCLEQWFETHSGCPLCRCNADNKDDDGNDDADDNDDDYDNGDVEGNDDVGDGDGAVASKIDFDSNDEEEIGTSV